MKLKSRINGGRRLAAFASALTLGGLSLAAVALGDDISNDLDASIDAAAEVMPLQQGGPAGTTNLFVTPRNGDGKNGCNLTGSTTLGVSVSSSNPGIATVSPSSLTFGSCDDVKTLSVTPVAVGSTTITVSQTSNNTGGTFNLAPATFTVNVTAPPPANTPPTISILGVVGGATYTKGAVPTATCNVTDAEDGPSSFPATLSAVTGPDAGTGVGQQTASCSYTDTGGLTASSSLTYTIADGTPPTITHTITGTLGDNGWYTSDVNVHWTVTEPDSPSTLTTSGCAPDVSVTVDQAETAYTCSASSSGGGPVTDTVKIKRDATEPTISGLRSPGANTFGWNNGSVAVDFTCDDNLSGVASCGPDTTLASEGAGQSATGNVKDNAGNTGDSATVSNINIDLTAPIVGVTGFTNGQVFTLGVDPLPTPGCSTSDALSDVQTNATPSSSGGPVGAITVTCSGGKDKADNPQSAPVSATYYVHFNWSGFFAPIDNPVTGKMNGVKAGSSVPVKFSLGGNQGLLIMALGSPASKAIACDTSDELSTDTPTTTAGSSSLSYDPVSQVYTYVWKTEKGWAGSCRRLTVTLTDGTVHYVDFKAMK